MAQRHRKTAEIVSLGMPVVLRDEIDAEVARQASVTRGVPLNRSQYILRAIRRDLAHARRSRRTRQSALEMEATDATEAQVVAVVEQAQAGVQRPAEAEEPPGVWG